MQAVKAACVCSTQARPFQLKVPEQAVPDTRGTVCTAPRAGVAAPSWAATGTETGERPEHQENRLRPARASARRSRTCVHMATCRNSQHQLPFLLGLVDGALCRQTRCAGCWLPEK